MGTDIWWCDVHGTNGTETACLIALNRENPELSKVNCRMVPMLLIPLEAAHNHTHRKDEDGD